MSSDFSEIDFSPYASKNTAVLVDLSFFIKVYQKSQGRYSSKEFVKRLSDYLFKTLMVYQDTLFRYYIYDSEPLSSGRIQKPISKQDYLFGFTPAYEFRTEVLKELKKQPYFAVRLGKMSGKPQWKLKANIQSDLLKGKKRIEDLKDEDFVLDIRQKGVDMKIGLDIATLSLKKQVEKIILIAGDSDFVPAVKFARREGIIIQLDPLRQNITDDLQEHIDLLFSILPDNKTNKKG